MTVDSLRERLGQFGAWTLPVFAEYLADEATVERVARAMHAFEFYGTEAFDEIKTDAWREYWLDRARAGLAALAAALASEGEAGDGAR